MKVYSPRQIAELDQLACERLGISSAELMERAGKAWSLWFMDKVRTGNHVHIWIGPGNNGGDGWVIGRVLVENGFNVTMVSPEYTSISKDHHFHKNNFLQLHKEKVTTPEHWRTILPIFSEDVIIDALFGISLNRPLSGDYLEYVNMINEQSCKIFSVDVPSGLHSELGLIGPCIRATYTGTMACAKPALFFREVEPYVGLWECIDIGWPRDLD